MANFFGTAGTDELDGTILADLIAGQGGEDVLDGGAGNDLLYGGLGGDWMTGGSGNDQLFGGAGDDVLSGDPSDAFFGNDVLDGGDGNDVLSGDLGADKMVGGNGIDTVDYKYANEAVSVDLRSGTGYGGEAQGDTYSSIEWIVGSGYSDVLIGNATIGTHFDGTGGDDIMIGGSGNDYFDVDEFAGDNDTITGGGGADHIDGGEHFDTAMYDTSAAAVRINLATGWGSGGDAQGDQLINIERVIGSKFDDALIGTDGADTLEGWMGNDHIAGGAGADTLSGGEGSDWLDYSSSSTSVWVGLSNSTASGGAAAGDMISGFENVVGSALNDYMWGSDEANQLLGFAGNDILSGLAGNDRLTGDFGQDTMTGGLGADRFQFYATSESSKSILTEDIITDFNHAQGDKIDLGVIDAKASMVENQSFSFIGSGKFTAEGQVRAYQYGGDTYVELNTSGTSGIDMGIKLSGVHDLVGSDFLL